MSKDNISETFKALMPLAVTSMTMETFKKLELQWKPADHMNAVFLMAMLPVANGMIRTLIGPELERSGLKPLKDQHWPVYRQETMGEFDWMAWLDRLNRTCFEAIEREIIRRLLREGG